MATRVLGPRGSRRRKRFLLGPILLVALASLFVIVGAQASPPEQAGFFELDKNLINNEQTVSSQVGTPPTAVALGTLGGNINSTATSFTVCQAVTGNPALPATIQIDAERMTVTSIASASGGGCTGAFKRTYTVTRHVLGTTAASHGASGVSGFVTLLTFNTVAGDDWDQVKAAVDANNALPVADQAANPCSTFTGSGWTGNAAARACDFIHDPPGATVFTTGGSKDDLDINTGTAPNITHNWMYTNQSVPDADDITDGYAIKYQGPNTGDHQFLYFGADRTAVNGAKDFGFWFFKSPVGLNPDGTFSGQHTVGDLLILGTFTNGGAATTIRIFKWVGPNNGADTNGVLLTGGNAGDCVPGGSSDLCNTVNNSTIKSPWAYQSKISGTPANTIYAGGAMEGGADLTSLKLEGCFSTFLAETRSAPSIGAQLKDFLIGKFESCGSNLTTTPSDADNNPLTDSDVPPNGLPDVSIGSGSVQVTDSADLNVNGTDTFSGDLSFHICGPIASGTCDTGGVPIALDGSNPVTANGTYNSVAATLTEAGRYCWRGDFVSHTTGVPDATDSSSDECFEVLPVTPTLVTQAVDADGNALTAAVPFGQAVYDKGTLSGAANGPGTDGGSDPGQPDNTFPSINATNGPDPAGTITFTLKGPDGDTLDCDTTATGTPQTSNPEDVTVDAGNGDYFTTGFTPDQPGSYHWIASYSGDSPNTNSTDHNTACDDTNEDVSVEQIPTNIKTKQSWYPNDTATVSAETGNLAAGGTVAFSLYANDTCDGTAFYSESVAIAGGNPSEEVGTSNTSVPITTLYDDAADSTTGKYSWKVVYTPAAADTSHTGKQSACDAEHFNITYTNDNGPGTDLP
jgi:hypothetical protein